MRVTGLLFLLFAAMQARAELFQMPAPGDDVIGEVYTVKVENYEDTMNQYAERYGQGFREMQAANPGVNPWVPGAGRELVVPAEYILPRVERVGVVINLAEQRMYWFQPDGRSVITYPVGIGREGWETPLVSTKVVKIQPNPTWYPPASIRAEHAAMGDPLPSAVPPGPDNPLGKWAVRLSVNGYLIHGSNKELGVGMRVSHGCMRMYADDIEHFATHVPVGTPVRIINVPVKVGMKGGAMYVEVHEPLEEQRQIMVSEEIVADSIHLARRIAPTPVEIDWKLAKFAAVRKSGMPTRVSAEHIATR